MTYKDETEIVRRVYEYAYGIDLRDWDLYRSIFTDRVTADFSSYNDRPAQTMSADDWVRSVRPLFTGLDASQHAMSNPVVDLDGGHARCRMYMQAVHILADHPDPEFTIGGYYDDRLVRTADGWQIEAVTLTVWWRRGNAAIMPIAAERGAALLEAP